MPAATPALHEGRRELGDNPPCPAPPALHLPAALGATGAMAAAGAAGTAARDGRAAASSPRVWEGMV